MDAVRSFIRAVSLFERNFTESKLEKLWRRWGWPTPIENDADVPGKGHEEMGMGARPSGSTGKEPARC
jgi:hypothetical protein